MFCHPPARPLSLPTNAERTHPSAEQSAADSEGGGGGAARVDSRTLQEGPVRLSQCHLGSPEQDRTRLQGIWCFQTLYLSTNYSISGV